MPSGAVKAVRPALKGGAACLALTLHGETSTLKNIKDCDFAFILQTSVIKGKPSIFDFRRHVMFEHLIFIHRKKFCA